MEVEARGWQVRGMWEGRCGSSGFGLTRHLTQLVEVQGCVMTCRGLYIGFGVAACV